MATSANAVRGMGNRTAIRVTLPENPKKHKVRNLNTAGMKNRPRLHYFNARDYSAAQDAAVAAAINCDSESQLDLGIINQGQVKANEEQDQQTRQSTTRAATSVLDKRNISEPDEQDRSLATNLNEADDSGKEMPTGHQKHKAMQAMKQSNPPDFTASGLAPQTMTPAANVAGSKEMNLIAGTLTLNLLSTAPDDPESTNASRNSTPSTPAMPLLRGTSASAAPKIQQRRRRRQREDLSIDGNARLNVLARDGGSIEEYLYHGRWYKVMGTEMPEWIEDRRWVKVGPQGNRRSTGKWREGLGL